MTLSNFKTRELIPEMHNLIINTLEMTTINSLDEINSVVCSLISTRESLPYIIMSNR